MKSSYDCEVEFEGGGKARIRIEAHGPFDAAFKAMNRCAHMFPGEGVTFVSAEETERTDGDSRNQTRARPSA